MKRKLLYVFVLIFEMFMFKNAKATEALHSGTCGNDCLWTWDTSGTLNITGEGDMISHPWTNIEGYQTDVTNIVIQGKITDGNGHIVSTGITSVPDSAFYWMQGVQHISIGDSVTTIGDSAFRSMWNVEGSLVIPNSVVNIGKYGAFWGLHGITSLTIPDSVTSIGTKAFFKVDGLTDLTIPDSVSTIGEYAFAKRDNDTGAPTINDSITNLTIGANTLSKYLEAMGGFTQTGDINIHCTTGNCQAILEAWDAANGTTYASRAKTIVTNSDGSKTVYDLSGNLIGYKGKRIYTIDEANQVAGQKNRVSIKYR